MAQSWALSGALRILLYRDQSLQLFLHCQTVLYQLDCKQAFGLQSQAAEGSLWLVRSDLAAPLH